MSAPANSILTAAAAVAARNGDLPALRSALQHISANARFEGDRPLLHFACMGQGDVTAALLLEHGADVMAKVQAPAETKHKIVFNECDDARAKATLDGSTALHAAAESGNANAMRLLIKRFLFRIAPLQPEYCNPISVLTSLISILSQRGFY
jgi:ankyrin repeat protein